eukprot:scaffold271472_cov44-Prasinocladus_malaysianus.AAC.1
MAITHGLPSYWTRQGLDSTMHLAPINFGLERMPNALLLLDTNKVTIPDLSPGTSYFFRICGEVCLPEQGKRTKTAKTAGASVL